METTRNYGLNKVGDDDFVDIVEHFNQNTEIIDDALGKKVDAEEGKILSDNNFTNELKEKLEQASEAKHKHSNKSVLDKITEALFNKWNEAVSHINDSIKHITAEERNSWNTVSNKADNEHTHEQYFELSGGQLNKGAYIDIVNENNIPLRLGMQGTWDADCTDKANVLVSNGNLHIDAKKGYEIYLNYINGSTNIHVGGNDLLLHTGNYKNYCTAQNISVSDTAGNFSSTNVEGVLAELASSLNDGSFLYGELSEYVEDTRCQSNSIKVHVGTFVCGSTESGFNYGVAENSWSVAIFDFNFELNYLPTDECGDEEYSRLFGKFKITFQVYSEYSPKNTQSNGASYNIKLDYENYTTYGENRIAGVLFKPYKDDDTWKVNIYLILESDTYDGTYRFANNFDIGVTYSKCSNPYNIKKNYNGSDNQSGYCCGASNLIDGETNSKYYISIFNKVDNKNLQYGTEILDLIITE